MTRRSANPAQTRETPPRAAGVGERVNAPAEVLQTSDCFGHEGVHAAFAHTQAARLVQKMLLDHFAPAAVLVNQEYEAIHFCGPTERFLMRPRGAPTQNLMALARDGLRSRLRGALEKAWVSGTSVVVDAARVKRDGAFAPVRLTVMPTAGVGAPNRFLLVVFEDPPASPHPSVNKGQESVLVRQLAEELRATKADLRDSIEKLENANEVLKLAYREAASANRKLQSANEALGVVNRQLQGKVCELEADNDELKDVLASSEIATLCLDRELCINWFTPATSRLLNIIASDVRRPFSDLSETPAAAGLLAEAQSVLKTQISMQNELHGDNGRCYVRRMLPYRCRGGATEGVVVTFTDITESKRVAEADIDARKSLTESLEQKVRRRTAQLRTLAVELTLAEERERRTLAQDLHDNLGQLLAVVKIKLASIGRNERRGNLKSALADIGALIDQANNAARSLAFEMSPPVLYELGLKPAVEWLADEMRRTYGLSVEIHDDEEPKPLEQANRAILFRAVRELLINVARHAEAGVAEVSFRRKGQRLAIEVTDGGVGFDPEKLSCQIGFGLLSVRERIGFIGGNMEIASAPGEGTAVTLTAPLSLESEAEEIRP